MERQFYKLYKGILSLSDFEKWLYSTEEIEKVYNSDFYLRLIELNYRDKYVKSLLLKILEPMIPFASFEQERITLYLEMLLSNKGDAVTILEETYNDYCNGYSFLRSLALNYISGIDSIPKLSAKEQFAESEFLTKRALLNTIQPKLTNEAKRLLAFFKKGKLKIIAEYDYLDTRLEVEQIELHGIEKMF
ncbi:hypothetical protein J2S19_000512 [Metabacillus malikii]|uniref:Uncharacterized protein n=2 Tax=Metabacillus malikii TaxID=1504265 RepID=A0ABT9ZAI5_9BACI|nr:hypothetical protein [Metabacillus malikii]